MDLIRTGVSRIWGYGNAWKGYNEENVFVSVTIHDKGYPDKIESIIT